MAKEWTERQKHCMNAMGLQQWQLKPEFVAAKPPEPESKPAEEKELDINANNANQALVDELTEVQNTLAELERALSESKPDHQWLALQQHIQNCHACALAQFETPPVVDQGNRQAKILILSEIPSQSDDPLSGQSGELLLKMLASIDLNLKNCALAFAVKCPTANHDKRVEDAATACRDNTVHLINVVKPKLILGFGHLVLQQLLENKTPISEQRGQLLEYRGIPLIATYHPNYLIRKPSQKRQAWEDLKFAREYIQKNGIAL